MIDNTRYLKMVGVACPSCGEKDGDVVGEGMDFEYYSSPDSFTMVACEQCGVIRLDPRPHASELEVIYPPSYIPYHFDTELGTISRVARKYFLRGRVKITHDLVGDAARILDVGCGNGDLLLLLDDFGPESWELAGMDISERAAASLQGRGITFTKGRFEELTRDQGVWDCIWMKDVIEHLENPGLLMETALRLLKPGGVLIMETPNFDGWDAQLFKRRYWGGWHFPRHWTIYNSSNMETTLLFLGFARVEIKSTLSPNFWAQSLHHWLSDTVWVRHIAGWFTARNFLLMGLFSAVDFLQILLTGKSSNMQVVAYRDTWDRHARSSHH